MGISARDAAEMILNQEREIKALKEKVRKLEAGLNQIVTSKCDDRIRALAWDALNKAGAYFEAADA